MALTPPPFVIFGTPRSRTAWLANLLTTDGWICHHEPSAAFRSNEDLRALLARPRVGIADSMLTLLAVEVILARADVRIVVVRRPIDEVLASLDKLTAFSSRLVAPVVEEIDAIAERIGRWPGALAVPYADLADDRACLRLARHCGVSLDPVRLTALQAVKIVRDLEPLLDQVKRNELGVRRLYGPTLDRCFRRAIAGERV